MINQLSIHSELHDIRGSGTNVEDGNGNVVRSVALAQHQKSSWVAFQWRFSDSIFSLDLFVSRIRSTLLSRLIPINPNRILS